MLTKLCGIFHKKMQLKQFAARTYKGCQTHPCSVITGRHVAKLLPK